MGRSVLGSHYVSVRWKGREAGAFIRHLPGPLVRKTFRGIQAFRAHAQALGETGLRSPGHREWQSAQAAPDRLGRRKGSIRGGLG